MDTITANPDRHTNNFGLLRDTETGALIGLAPNYDNNMALISRGYPSMPKKNDLLITLFNELIARYPEFKEYIPKIDEMILKTVISKLGMKVKGKYITDLVLARYRLIVQNQ